jgi:hypothetical protein
MEGEYPENDGGGRGRDLYIDPVRDRDSKYLICPIALLRRTSLDYDTILVFTALRAQATGKNRGESYPGRQTLANMIGMHRRSVTRKINNLKEAALIKLEPRSDRLGRTTTPLHIPLWHQIWEDEYQAVRSQPSGRAVGEPQAWSVFSDESFHSFFIPQTVAKIPERRVSAVAKFLCGTHINQPRSDLAERLGLARRSSSAADNRLEIARRQITHAKRELQDARIIEIEHWKNSKGSRNVKFVAPHAWFKWGEPRLAAEDCCLTRKCRFLRFEIKGPIEILCNPHAGRADFVCSDIVKRVCPETKWRPAPAPTLLVPINDTVPASSDAMPPTNYACMVLDWLHRAHFWVSTHKPVAFGCFIEEDPKLGNVLVYEFRPWHKKLPPEYYRIPDEVDAGCQKVSRREG